MKSLKIQTRKRQCDQKAYSKHLHFILQLFPSSDSEFEFRLTWGDLEQYRDVCQLGH